MRATGGAHVTPKRSSSRFILSGTWRSPRPAREGGPMALRPRLATGLPFRGWRSQGRSSVAREPRVPIAAAMRGNCYVETVGCVSSRVKSAFHKLLWGRPKPSCPGLRMDTPASPGPPTGKPCPGVTVMYILPRLPGRIRNITRQIRSAGAVFPCQRYLLFIALSPRFVLIRTSGERQLPCRSVSGVFRPQTDEGAKR